MFHKSQNNQKKGFTNKIMYFLYYTETIRLLNTIGLEWINYNDNAGLYNIFYAFLFFIKIRQFCFVIHYSEVKTHGKVNNLQLLFIQINPLKMFNITATVNNSVKHITNL